MKIKSISAKYERKFDLEKWHSVHIGMTLWADLDDGDDEGEAGVALREMARNQVMSEMSRLKPELQPKIQQLLMGLPLELRETALKHLEGELNNAN